MTTEKNGANRQYEGKSNNDHQSFEYPAICIFKDCQSIMQIPSWSDLISCMPEVSQGKALAAPSFTKPNILPTANLQLTKQLAKQLIAVL